MNDYLIIQIIVTFIVGGIWVSGLTYVCDKYCDKLGAILYGAPSTCMVSFLFIYITQGHQQLTDVVHNFPTVSTVSMLFPFLFYILTKQNKPMTSLVLAMLFWILAQVFIIYYFNPAYLETILWWFIILTLILTYYRQSRINVERKILINPKNIDKYILRFIISGSIIALAVLTSKFFGSTIGSVMAAFPASFLSGLFISIRTNYLSQSQRLALGMSTSGLLNTIPFAIILYILLLHYHALLALSTAFAVSIIMSVISYKYIMRTNPT